MRVGTYGGTSNGTKTWKVRSKSTERSNTNELERNQVVMVIQVG